MSSRYRVLTARAAGVDPSACCPLAPGCFHLLLDILLGSAKTISTIFLARTPAQGEDVNMRLRLDYGNREALEAFGCSIKHEALKGVVL
jgi:hypothetical protein